MRFPLTLMLLVPLGAYAQTAGPAVSLKGDTATLVWTSNAAIVKYGAYGRLDSQATATSQNNVKISGLKPGQLYRYELASGGTASFTTPPPKDGPVGLSRYTFAVIGDSRVDNETYRQIAPAVALAKPSFVVHTGDLVTNGGNEAQWELFLSLSKDFLQTAAFFPAMGNYDANSPLWHRYFDRPSAYYSFDWGRAHWAVLNSQATGAGGDPESYWSAELNWLEQDLQANASADYLFVVIHHPPFSAVREHGEESAAVNARVVPIFKKYKVSMVFSGHDHNYQRHLDSGIQYVVSAGAGTASYDPSASIPGITQKAERSDCFVFAKVDGDQITFEARAASGRVLDTFQLAARKGVKK